MMFNLQTLSASFLTALLLVPGDAAQAEPSLETRAPHESKELDRDENGKPDAYRETYILDNGLTIDTHERFEEGSGKLTARMTFIKVGEKYVWEESYLTSLRERNITVSRQSPFTISTAYHGRSGKGTVTLVGDKASLAAVLVREKGGRWAPVTEEELEHLRKLGDAVSEFALGVLDQAEELKDSKDKANEHLRRLDDAASEYARRGSEQANPPTESEGKTK
jgi:hypothetical protein